MDLIAYSQIKDLSALAEANHINIPRLRGYRMMLLESPVTKDDLNGLFKDAERYECENGCSSIPAFAVSPSMFEYSSRTNRLEKKYLVFDENGNFVKFNWNLLHGKKRRNLKLAIKNRRKRILKSIEAWNRYAGAPDVLYIHARIGGPNWKWYGGDELRRQPWFIEKVDDPWDNTYCDIYAKIKIRQDEDAEE